MNALALVFGLMSLSTSGATPFSVPEGYELQVLEPTGGKIARPAGWFYRERHGRSFTWIISKEDPNNGPYETGIRIQVFAGVKEHTGKTAEVFVRDFFAQKKSSASVLSECEPQKQYLFTRVCLETEEFISLSGPPELFHIQYSMFWGDGSDIAVITTAGSPASSWPTYEKTFNTMGKFELIDMSRFAKGP